MKKNGLVFLILFLSGVFYNSIVSGQNPINNNSFMVRHTVVFKLKHPKDSPEEKEFLSAIRKLSSIPGVKKFECLKQVSKKNKFDYGLSMEFESQKTYDAYSNHHDHNAFVNKYWLTEVEDFLEIDFEPFQE
jgi:hypothetical protein